MIPANTLERLSKLYGMLQALDPSCLHINSRTIADIIGTTDFTVRKDIGTLKGVTYTRKGYDVHTLSSAVARVLNLGERYRTCVVGIGRLGSALLGHDQFSLDGFDIIAGFDININKIERIQTSINLYPISEMENIIKGQGIEIAIIATPQKAAQEVADMLIAFGIKGILNLSAVHINVPENVSIYNLDIAASLRIVVSQIKK